MEDKIFAECGHCGKDQDFEISEGQRGEDYPCGKCPKYCSHCKERICPYCGGKLQKESSSDEIRDYCGEGCNDCAYEHCGGCV